MTEEGTLLASIQGDDVIDYDIDAYTSRLDEVSNYGLHDVDDC